MSNKQETVADIVADMRGLVKHGETLEHTYELLNGLADSIEAAHKREVDALTEKLDVARHCWKVWSERADELKNKCDEQYAKLKTAGNGAKLREALKYIKQWSEDCISEEGADNVDGMIAVVDAALAEPPRNCDRYATHKDAMQAFEAFVREQGKLGFINPYTEAFKWLFAPYKTKGETDENK